MTIEIQSIELKDGVITIEAIDVSEEHLQYIERVRDDGSEQIVKFQFNTTSEGTKSERNYIFHWLHKQKAAKGSRTYGEALQKITGTITQINSAKYRVWD